MNRINAHTFAIFALSGLLLAIPACQQQQQPPATTSPPVANNSANVAMNANTSAPSVNADLPVTMPLLDAMFADESFAAAAKQELQLTDEEVRKIEDSSRNTVLQLGADASEDDARSTRASVVDARKKLVEILGNERADRFINFVKQRWSSGSQQLALNRPNEVPRDTRIVVNAPAYRMDIYKDGQLVKTYKIGIGYPEFPLPTGLRKASEIIFNPTWTPPDEPWVKGKVRPGKTVEAGSTLNPLGPIKIPIGLPSLIHGGKDRSRLGNFASHGCVGLTNPMVQDFAVQLASISGTSLSMEDVKAYGKKKEDTKEVDLAADIPIELRYETIVVEDGKVIVYRDVYERGTNTEDNLRKVLEAYGASLDQLPDQERSQLLDALKQMAVDAAGEAVTEPTKNTNSNKNAANSSGKVTKNVKGKKEIAVAVSSLQGKGYPLPVQLSER